MATNGLESTLGGRLGPVDGEPDPLDRFAIDRTGLGADG